MQKVVGSNPIARSTYSTAANPDSGLLGLDSGFFFCLALGPACSEYASNGYAIHGKRAVNSARR